MLGSADRAVVHRDPHLRGLRLLLDEAALGEWITHRLDADVRVVPSRVRYKPRTSCVLAFSLHRPGQQPVPCIARTYSAEAAAKMGKDLRDLAAHDVLVVHDEERVVVTTIAGDRHLPGPVRLFAGDEARVALLQRLLPGRDDLHTAPVRTIRHNPERRWVGLLEGAAGPVVLRGYRGGAADGPITAYDRLADGASTPVLLGRSRKRAMVAVSWVEGAALDVAAPPEAFAAAGAALAHLHSRPRRRGLERVTTAVHARGLRKAQGQVSDLLPPLRGAVDDTVSGLLAGRPAAPNEPVVLHGDFSTDQAVVDADGTVTLIDLDSACVGDAAQDLGSMWAAALVDAEARGTGPESRMGALLDAYAALRPLPAPETVAWYRDAFVLRRAAEGFRSRRTDWSEHMARTIELARNGVVR